MVDHPDRRFINFLLNGFSSGFRIGFEGLFSLGLSNNLLSAREQDEVSAAILKELEIGHTSGPFVTPPFELHCLPLGAVHKKDGSWRIILDLSSPRGSPVNEGILHDKYSVKYLSFDDAIGLIYALNPGAFMGKLDI